LRCSDNDKRKKSDKVLDKIQDCIVQGTFKPNNKIYSENQLANILGLNRNAVRETITALEILGIVQSRQGEGTFLTPLNMDNCSKVLSLLILLEQGDQEEIVLVRRILETAAAELSARNRTPEELIDMEVCLKNMMQFKDFAEISKEDARFHTIVAGSTGNALLKNLITVFAGYISQTASESWKRIKLDGNKFAEIIYKHHCDLMDAIKEGDPSKARHMMEKHMDFLEQILSSSSKESHYCKEGLRWFDKSLLNSLQE